jgi:hypothetical protein
MFLGKLISICKCRLGRLLTLDRQRPGSAPEVMPPAPWQALTIDGENPSTIPVTLAQKVPIKGLFASIACRVS